MIAPSAPLNVELQEKTATSLLVTWKAPEYPNGIIQGYRIIYSNNTGKNYSTADITKGLQNETLFYLLSGLKKDREYKIYVSTYFYIYINILIVIRNDNNCIKKKEMQLGTSLVYCLLLFWSYWSKTA